MTQTIRGIVTDGESKQPLPGVIVVLTNNNQVNTTTDSDGAYRLNNVPIGRQSVQYIMAGYDKRSVNEVLVSSGKETELNITLTENINTLKEVSVTARKDKSRAVNEFASVSSRSFSVEDTRRYPASVSDPARMSMDFAGVANNGDLENDIVIRGNSPKGVLWRLEGIEIPNPNHFSDLGSTGGAVSMVNANTLGTSDFYSGAFPPEMGDALSGIFDLTMRNGNTDHREYIFEAGILGTELAAEGPFKKGGQASYLIDYRYNTLGLILDKLNLNGIIPQYQDLSFKLNFPMKKAGTISIFGLGGLDKDHTNPENDSTKWSDSDPNLKMQSRGNLGVTGIDYQYFVNSHAYIKAIVAASYTGNKKDADTLNTDNMYNPVPVEHDNFQYTNIEATALYNNKIDVRNTIRTGISAKQMYYSLYDNYYDFGARQWSNVLNGNGNTQFYQAYFQWKYRINEQWTLMSGVNASYFALNNKYSLEPRASISYRMKKSSITLATGLHSKPDDISTYVYQTPAQTAAGIYPNKNLDMLRAYHAVLGYEVFLPLKSSLKLEFYYQYLYHIPVDSTNGFSILNIESAPGLVGTNGLVSKGTGQNYGVDLTLDRPFANNYYVLLTASLYKTTYTTLGGQTFEGHFDRRGQLNVVGGKEFNLDAKKTMLLGLNTRIVYSGGQRESLIDATQSLATGETVYIPNEYFTLKDPYYFRWDGSIYFKLNNKRATHTLEFDVQDITNRRNYSYTYYDSRSGRVKDVLETGLIPVISYRIEFHGKN